MNELLNKKHTRQMEYRFLFTLGGVLLAGTLSILGYIIVTGTNLKSDGQWTHTGFKWYDWVIPLVSAILLFIWAGSIMDCFAEDFVCILKGKVVGHYQTNDRWGSEFYVVIEGTTKAGENGRYNCELKPEYWDSYKIGDIIDLTVHDQIQ